MNPTTEPPRPDFEEFLLAVRGALLGLNAWIEHRCQIKRPHGQCRVCGTPH